MRRGSSAVEQEIHKLLVVGSIPTPATGIDRRLPPLKSMSDAEVVEQADTQRSGRCALMRVWVQIPPSAPWSTVRWSKSIWSGPQTPRDGLFAPPTLSRSIECGESCRREGDGVATEYRLPLGRRGSRSGGVHGSTEPVLSEVEGLTTNGMASHERAAEATFAAVG